MNNMNIQQGFQGNVGYNNNMNMQQGNQGYSNVNNMNYGVQPNYISQQPINPQVPQINVNVNLQFQYRGMNMFFTQDPLAELANANAAIIRQEIELLEILTGCETKNRYHVYIRGPNGQFTYLFKCKEESGWCMRNCIS